MKAWQNERCFQLEPWLFHYFNIYKDEPPTVVWAMQYAILCVFVWEREREREGKERETEAEVETDKQSESKGVAQSDKLNPMNEQSSKKWLIHGYVPCISVCPPVQRAVRLQRCSQRREKHLSDQSLDKRPQRGDAQEESRSKESGSPSLGSLLAWEILWNCLASHTDSEMGGKSGREMAQGVRKSHIWNRCCKRVWAEYRWGGGLWSVRSLPKDSIHSTSLTQIQTSQEADGFRRRMKEVEGGKWGEAGLKVGHVSGVKGCRGRGYNSGRQTERQTVNIVCLTMYSYAVTDRRQHHFALYSVNG